MKQFACRTRCFWKGQNKKRSRETVAGLWKTVSVLILVPIFMSTMSMPLQNSDMDIKDMKIGTRISTETVFQGPATVSLDLFLCAINPTAQWNWDRWRCRSRPRLPRPNFRKVFAIFEVKFAILELRKQNFDAIWTFWIRILQKSSSENPMAKFEIELWKPLSKIWNRALKTLNPKTELWKP